MNKSTVLAVLVAALVPGIALAQSPWIAPSVSIGVAYDDNIFGSAEDAQDDMLLRVTPTLEAGFRSARGSTRLLHSFDAEKYRDNTQLDHAQVRRYTELDLDYRMTERFEIALLASAAASENPGDLLPEFGLELGRADARRTTVAPRLEYRFTPRTSGTAGLEIARDDLVGGLTADTRGGYVGVTHRTTPRSLWGLELVRRDYTFRPGGDSHSNILLLGWTGELSPRTTFSVRAGPRQTEVDTQLEAIVALNHAIQGGEFSANYERSERTILGQSALAETNTFWLVYGHSLTPTFGVRFIPSYTSLSRGDRSAETVRFGIEANYHVTQMISLTSSYQMTKQSGSLEREEPIEFTRNLVFIGMTVAFAPRVGQVPPAEIRRRNR